MIRTIAAAFWFSFILAGSAFAQSCGSYPNTLTNGNNADANQVMANLNFILNCFNTSIGNQSVPRSYLAGLTLATPGSSSAFSVAAGVATSSDFTTLMKLSSSVSKTTGAWVVGSANGALDTGLVAASTWYHVYLIQRPDTGVVDICISLSPTGPTFGSNIPSNYTLFRRIGSMKTNSSSQWVAFTQVGNEFLWSVPTADYNATAAANTQYTVTLGVPTGVSVEAIIATNYESNGTGNCFGLFYSGLGPTQTSNTPNGNINIYAFQPSTWQAVQLRLMTSTSGQVRLDTTTSFTAVLVSTSGWIDTRGRDP
jgi:hypothetical protein